MFRIPPISCFWTKQDTSALTHAKPSCWLCKVYNYRGKWGMKPVAYIYGWLMVANALLHGFLSLWQGQLLAGVWSSPLVLVCSFNLLQSIPRRSR